MAGYNDDPAREGTLNNNRRCPIAGKLAVQAGAGAVRMILGFTKGATLAFGKVSKDTLVNIGTRIGLSGLRSMNVPQIAARVGAAIQNNKLATALVAWEVHQLIQSGHPDGVILQQEFAAMGVDLSEVISELREDPELRGIIEQLTFQQDMPAGTDNVSDIGRFREEFAIIRNVIRRFGSLEAALEVRNFMSLGNDTILLYRQFQDLMDS